MRRWSFTYIAIISYSLIIIAAFFFMKWVDINYGDQLLVVIGIAYDTGYELAVGSQHYGWKWGSNPVLFVIPVIGIFNISRLLKPPDHIWNQLLLANGTGLTLVVLEAIRTFRNATVSLQSFGGDTSGGEYDITFLAGFWLTLLAYIIIIGLSARQIQRANKAQE